MRILLIASILKLAISVEIPFFFDATHAPEILQDQLGMREAMDVWGHMIRKMTNGDKPDNVRQQVVRPKKVDKSLLLSVPKARGEIINERLLNMLLPRIRTETMATTTTTLKPTTIKSISDNTTASIIPKIDKPTTISSTTVSPVTEKDQNDFANKTLDQEQSSYLTENQTTISTIPDIKIEETEQKENKSLEVATILSDNKTNLKSELSPNLSVRIHTANETDVGIESAVLSILKETMVDKLQANHSTGTKEKNNKTAAISSKEYTEEILVRNSLKEKEWDNEEALNETDKISGKVSDVSNPSSTIPSSTFLPTVATTHTIMPAIKSNDLNLTRETFGIETDSHNNIKEESSEQNVLNDSEHEETTENSSNATEVSLKPDHIITDETSVNDTKQDENVNNDDSSAMPLAKVQQKFSRIPDAEDEDMPAFVQGDYTPGSEKSPSNSAAIQQDIEGNASAGGTVYNIQANSNSDSQPVQTSVITPITGILDTIRPLMYYFTRPIQASGVRTYDPKNDANYYGYGQSMPSPQMTLQDLTSSITKRILGRNFENTNSVNRMNLSSIESLQKNVLETFTEQNTVRRTSSSAPIFPEKPKKRILENHILQVDGASGPESNTPYFAPVIPETKYSTLPIIRPEQTHIEQEIVTPHVSAFENESGLLMETTRKTPVSSIAPKEPTLELKSATDIENFPSFDSGLPGSFGGGRTPSIPLETETDAPTSDILSFFDNSNRARRI